MGSVFFVLFCFFGSGCLFVCQRKSAPWVRQMMGRAG
jgi:hypothetical protein